MSRIWENIVLGAGASGLMLCSLLKNRRDTLLLEKGREIGAKIAISGGGQCNLCNMNPKISDYRGEPQFIEAVIKRFDRRELLKWFENRALKTTLREGGKIFCSGSARDVVDIFAREIEGVTLKKSFEVKRAYREGRHFVVEGEKESFRSKNLIVALGGRSYPKLGGGDTGLQIAESFSDSIVSTAPALTGFTPQKEQFFFRELSGISTYVTLKVGERVFAGDLLFAHRGISGPVVLDASLWWERGEIEIDFLPSFSFDRVRSSKKLLSTVLPLPKRLSKVLIELAGVEDRNCYRLTRGEWKRLEVLGSYRFAPAGTFGYARAEVMRGGVDCAEIDPQTMMSRLEEGLFFIGEVLDVTGRVGGYNFQWAFSSAKVCADTLNGGDNRPTPT